MCEKTLCILLSSKFLTKRQVSDEDKSLLDYAEDKLKEVSNKISNS